jgi:hypothetical protein
VKLSSCKSFSFQCGTEIFMKKGDAYEKMPFAIAPDNCCNILSNKKYKEAMANQNVPKECPIKVVSILYIILYTIYLNH